MQNDESKRENAKGDVQKKCKRSSAKGGEVQKEEKCKRKSARGEVQKEKCKRWSAEQRGNQRTHPNTLVGQRPRVDPGRLRQVSALGRGIEAFMLGKIFFVGGVIGVLKILCKIQFV